jgi:LacI family transcriptional regulator
MVTNKRVTIKEVAQAAGVSTQTISRVLNDRPDVSADTRQRVRAIIEALGYSPNALARSLIRGRSHTIGVVGYGLRYYGPSQVLTGIERRANELGYSLILSLLREPESDSGEEAFKHLLDRQVDGVIWAVPQIGSNRDWVAGQPQRPGCPVVFINTGPGPGMAVAAIDNHEGGRLAVEHLLEQGYRRIGIITGPNTWWESQQRELGWREAMASAGISSRDLDALKVSGDWYPSSGEAGLEALIHRDPNLEAVFALNDLMAAGALLTARRLGRRVPQELAIVGFDDTPEAPYYSPALSTIRQPLVEMGTLAVDMLIGMLEGQPGTNQSDPKWPVLWLHPTLIVRESSLSSV